MVLRRELRLRRQIPPLEGEVPVEVDDVSRTIAAIGSAMNAPMKPAIRPPTSSAKITSSGLIRSAWPNTFGATTWPSSCCSTVNAMISQTASIGCR